MKPDIDVNKMNCPKCGSPKLADQKFCRSCGASLQMTTQPLAEPGSVLENRPATIFKEEKQQASNLVLWGFIMMFIGVAVGVIGKKLLHEDLVTVVGVLISLAGMFLSVYPYLRPPGRQRYDAGPSSQPEPLTQSAPAKYLPQEGNIEFVPGITERTTDLLNSAATRPKQKQDRDSQA